MENADWDHKRMEENAGWDNRRMEENGGWDSKRMETNGGWDNKRLEDGDIQLMASNGIQAQRYTGRKKVIMFFNFFFKLNSLK